MGHSFSLTFGGIFLTVVFSWGPKRISDATIRILYGVFTALTLVGILFLALLRMPAPEKSADKKGLSQWEILSKLFKLELGKNYTSESSFELCRTL